MKVDLCMWAKNGAKMLPFVLKRIDEVIPKENVSNKIFVDDHSVDKSVEIAKKFDWQVHENKEGFISGGANEALRHVESSFLVSVEQDIVLARNWWKTIPKYMKDPKVAVAQGVRLPTLRTLRCLDEYRQERFKETRFNLSLDNNIFRTSVIRKLGGFPKQDPLSVDLNLFDSLNKTGYKWIVDSSVVSDHIRESIMQDATHQYKLFMLSKREQLLDRSNTFELYRMLMTSPLRALDILVKKRCPEIFFAYPFIRLMTLKTFLDSKKHRVIRLHRRK